MYCTNCGAELRHDAQFCKKCGALALAKKGLVERFRNEDGLNGLLTASQTRDAHLQTRSRQTPLTALTAIAAVIVAAAIAVGVFTFALPRTQNGNALSWDSRSAPQVQGQQQGANRTSSDNGDGGEAPISSTGEKTSRIKAFIESLDGYWQSSEYSREGSFDYLYIHDGVGDWYSANGEYLGRGRTYDQNDAVRFDAGLSSGEDGRYNGGAGYFIYGPGESRDGSYVSDNSPDVMATVRIDGTGYSKKREYHRVDAPSWAVQ